MIAAFLFSAVAFASHPPYIARSYLSDAGDGKKKLCIVTNSGWGDNRPKCSAPVEAKDPVLVEFANVIKVKENVEVGLFNEGFSIKDLVDSIAVENCELNQSSQDQIKAINAQIQQMKDQISTLTSNAANRSCNPRRRGANGVLPPTGTATK